MKIGALALMVAVFASSPEIRYFRYERPVQNLPQKPVQTCLALDAGLFAHAAPQLADLRLYRDGAETPYVIRAAAPLDGEAKTITPLNVGARGGHAVFDAELPEGHYGDVQLAVTGVNFIATVTVTGSRSQ